MAAQSVGSVSSKHFHEVDLQPTRSPSAPDLIWPDIIDEIAPLADSLSASGSASADSWSDTQRAWLSMMAALGAVKINDDRTAVTTGRFARDVSRSLVGLMRLGGTAFADWNEVDQRVDDKVSALELVQHLESARIGAAKDAGEKPEVFHERSVVYAVLKANRGAKSYYLFENNPEWHRLGLIGGGVEPDDESVIAALEREIEEETGIRRERVSVIGPIGPEIVTYGLSGGYGSLTKYAGKVYYVQFTGEYKPRANHSFYDREHIRRLVRESPDEFMLPRQYMELIADGVFESQPPSGKFRSASSLWRSSTWEWLADHKEVAIGALGLLAAIITLLAVLV